MSTPHIDAKEGDFAKTVLMPGDPLRAKHIADTFLEDVVEVTAVRNMLGFTGVYRGVRVSVMGSGMGIPSASIYATELIKFYGVENIIRVGTCGAVHEDVKLLDVIMAMGASTDSNVNRMRFEGYDFSAICDFDLLRTAWDMAMEREIPVRVGNIYSADLFYTPKPEMFERMKALGILGVDMEAAGLYGVAAEYGTRALTILTVSDHIVSGEKTSAMERQTRFNSMLEIALDTAVRLGESA
jgi:purine-nucleoside phosphorylase